ncbi:peptidylprolyl isomerase [Arthrobacter sp. zg-Y877]|uniref:peptidylprolyl isomerase n=1 Tax=Arthrobacter sp. zg-Y877 TaxID=3049074 RepID=UPI0025A4572E|nr:peptidylprolyl isomerase [Arthrobacter sp. zg-Y877]MDM7989422.1 peptidylprolyl isomerase [Arthrobacter sp. zg-Y877]
MAAHRTSRTSREDKRRVARMEARRAFAAARTARRKRDNVFAASAAAAVLALAVALQVSWFGSNPSAEELALLREQAAVADVREVPDPSLAEGKTFTGSLSLGQGEIGVELDGSAAPQAAAVFKTLADEGYFAGKSCHRMTATESMSVLQCGSETGDGQADPDFQWGPVENTPADGFYPAGTIAVARGEDVMSHGTQFFIVYKDSTITQETGGYTIMGKVTSGLDVLEAIASQGIDSGKTDGSPNDPVTISSFTLN